MAAKFSLGGGGSCGLSPLRSLNVSHTSVIYTGDDLDTLDTGNEPATPTYDPTAQAYLWEDRNPLIVWCEKRGFPKFSRRLSRNIGTIRELALLSEEDAKVLAKKMRLKRTKRAFLEAQTDLSAVAQWLRTNGLSNYEVSILLEVDSMTVLTDISQDSVELETLAKDAKMTNVALNKFVAAAKEWAPTRHKKPTPLMEPCDDGAVMVDAQIVTKEEMVPLAFSSVAYAPVPTMQRGNAGQMHISSGATQAIVNVQESTSTVDPASMPALTPPPIEQVPSFTGGPTLARTPSSPIKICIAPTPQPVIMVVPAPSKSCCTGSTERFLSERPKCCATTDEPSPFNDVTGTFPGKAGTSGADPSCPSSEDIPRQVLTL